MRYNVFDPKIDRPLHTLPRKDAEVAYYWFIENIPTRIYELKQLLLDEGLLLDFSESSLSKLHNWFFDLAQKERSHGNTAPSPELFSICNDIGIYISEMLRSEGQTIKWTFYTSNKKGVSYQRPVLTGFDVKNKDYHIDLDYLICQYAFRIIKSGNKEDELFLSMYRKAKTLL